MGDNINMADYSRFFEDEDDNDDIFIGDSDPLMNGSKDWLANVKVEPAELLADFDDSYVVGVGDINEEAPEVDESGWGFFSQNSATDSLGGSEGSVVAKKMLLPKTSLPFLAELLGGEEQYNGGPVVHHYPRIEKYLNPEDSAAEHGGMIIPFQASVPIPGPSSAVYAQPQGASKPKVSRRRRAGGRKKKNRSAAKQKGKAGAKVAAEKTAKPKTKTPRKSNTIKRHEKYLSTKAKEDLGAFKARQNREKKKAEFDQMEAKVDTLQVKNNLLQAQLDGCVQENERLRQRIQQLELLQNHPHN